MKSEESPLISVMTPVYNGERYLAECIQSVLDQTYQNWEYIILNNCSDDASLQIANSYARKDSRVRVISNDRILPIMQNWNHGIKQISPLSKYFKMVHADDLLFPTCLEKMALLAEKNPMAGLVGAYRTVGASRVEPRALPDPKSMISGSSACRLYLLQGIKVFGTPSSILIRADLIRNRDYVYNENSTQFADTELCFSLLQNSEFGFVHQILTYTRQHDSSITGMTSRLMPHNMGKLQLLKLYGDTYLTKDEFKNSLTKVLYEEHVILCRALIRSERKEIWDYHKSVLAKIGYHISWTTLLRALAGLVALNLINPQKMFQSMLRKATGRQKSPTTSRRDIRRQLGI